MGFLYYSLHLTTQGSLTNRRCRVWKSWRWWSTPRKQCFPDTRKQMWAHRNPQQARQHTQHRHKLKTNKALAWRRRISLSSTGSSWEREKRLYFFNGLTLGLSITLQGRHHPWKQLTNTNRLHTFAAVHLYCVFAPFCFALVWVGYFLFKIAK